MSFGADSLLCESPWVG